MHEDFDSKEEADKLEKELQKLGFKKIEEKDWPSFRKKYLEVQNKRWDAKLQELKEAKKAKK